MSTGSSLAVAVAIVTDRWLVEPPTSVHPTVWMGRLLDCLAAVVPPRPLARALAGGLSAWLLGVATTMAAATALDRSLRRIPAPLRMAGGGMALWPLVSLQLLIDEVVATDKAVHDLPVGRAAVARLVSRPVEGLDHAGVRAAAIESLAENLNDALVAPLCWYAVGGLPAAAVYRFVNTADAMWGYRDHRWRHAGRVAARADDAANWVPARLTAILLCSLAGPGRADRLWCLTRHDARRTPSPNAGWPMAAMAHRLDVRLDKHHRGLPRHRVYVLNEAGRSPAAGDISTAGVWARTAGYVAAAVTAAGCVARERWRRCRR